MSQIWRREPDRVDPQRLWWHLSGTSVWRPQSRYTVLRTECRTKFPQNRRCRAKIALHPPKSRFRTFLRTPLSHFPLIPSREGARRAGGGYRGTLGSENGSRYRGVSQLQSHQSRYSVQLRARHGPPLGGQTRWRFTFDRPQVIWAFQCPKSRRSRNEWTFWRIFGLSRVFSGTFCRPPNRPLLRLLCDFGPGGPGDSCYWRLGSEGSLTN